MSFASAQHPIRPLLTSQVLLASPVTGAAVIVNSSGQLGVRAASIKYKEDVHDIADDDSALMRFPELVVKDSNGQPMSVQYHELPALLLKQLQTQRNQSDSQNRTIGLLEKRLTDLEAKLK